MRNKNGFTLIELISIIIILGIIGLITVPAINGTIQSSKTKALEKQKESIVNITKEYILDHTDLLPETDGESKQITLTDLKSADLITNEDIINPSSNEVMNGCVTITYNGLKDKYSYEYIDECQ